MPRDGRGGARVPGPGKRLGRPPGKTALPEETRFRIAAEYLARVQLRKLAKLPPPHREIVISELMEKFDTTDRMVVRCIDEMGRHVKASSKAILRPKKPKGTPFTEAAVLIVQNQLAQFRHASRSIIERVTREWFNGGEEDAKRRGLSRREWLRKRSKFLADH
jgi:hypothetical protein